MKPRRIFTLLASFAVTALFLALALRNVDLNKLARAFAAADYRLAVAALLCWLTGYGLRTARWQRLLSPSKSIPLARLFPFLVIGFALNNLLPGRPGEFARAIALGEREGLPKTLCFATVVVERVLDGIAIVAFLMLALAGFGVLRLPLLQGVETIAVLASVLFGVALGGLALLLGREATALARLQQATRLLPRGIGARLERMLGAFVTGLRALQSPADVWAMALLTLGVWSLDAGAYFFMLSAFDALPLDAARVVAAVTLTGVINLGIMIPAAPGGLGPYEAAGVFALGAFRVDETVAASVALCAHAVQYLMITGLGLFFIWREGISLARARDE